MVRRGTLRIQSVEKKLCPERVLPEKPAAVLSIKTHEYIRIRQGLSIEKGRKIAKMCLHLKNHVLDYAKISLFPGIFQVGAW
jgi:hypothetical protein